MEFHSITTASQRGIIPSVHGGYGPYCYRTMR